MTAAASPGGLLPTRALFHESWKWLRKNWIRTLVFSLLSFVIAWGWNVWIMARKLEGSVAEPGSSTTATAQGHTWNGIYWLLCTTILFGLITYGREKGFKNLLREFFTPPFTFFDNLARRPRSAIAMGCWGAALALLVGSVVSNAISGLLGLGFLLAAPTALAIVLNNVLIRGWTGVFSAMQPRLKDNAAALANPYAMMFGEAIGALIAWRASGAIVPVVLAVILIVVSFVVVAGGAGKALPNPMPLILLIGAGIVTWKVLHATPARADDGGWSECATANGDPCSSLSFFRGWWEWRKSAGADVVIRQGRVGGTFSALGCLLGCMLGGGLAAVAAAFSSSSTGGLGSGFAQLSPPGGTPPAGAPPAGAAHGVGSALSQPPQPGTGLPQPGATGTPAPHSVGQPLASSGTPGTGASAGTGAPAGTGARSGGPPAPSPVARAGNVPPGGQPPPPPPPPGAAPGPAPAGAPHGIAQGTEALHGHGGGPADVTPTGAGAHRTGRDPELRSRLTRGRAPRHRTRNRRPPRPRGGGPADVTPTGAARTAPDVTPSSAPGSPAGAPHGIAQGTEGLHGHGGGQPADVTPTGAGRHAPDVTPGHPGQGGDVTPTGATRSAPDVTPTGAGRHAPDVTPGHPGQASEVTPTGATRGAPDVTPSHSGGAAQPPTPPPPGQQPPTPGRHMLDDVLPDEDKFDEEDGESGES